MKRFIKTLFLILIISMLVVTLISCKKDGDDTNNNNVEKQQELKVSENVEGAKLFTGYIGNTTYDRVEGVEISFGEDPEYAATSDEDGKFSFYYINTYDYTNDRILDFLSMDSEEYKYRAFIDTSTDDNPNIGINCIVVVDDADSDFNMNEIGANLSIRMSFGQAGNMITKLPVGYPLENEEFVETERLATEHLDTVFGVKLYLDDVYFDYSRNSGYHIPYIIFGTVIRLEHPGFVFYIKPMQGFQEALDGENNDQYTYVGNEGEFVDFRALPIDNNADVLTDNQDWWQDLLD